ncbi:MAG: preprotein translocase subunit TatA [Halanaeroarchaeum sp.]
MFPVAFGLVGMPGGVELLVILFIFAVLFGIPITVLLLLGYRFTQRASEDPETDERIEELEADVSALKERLEDER